MCAEFALYAVTELLAANRLDYPNFSITMHRASLISIGRWAPFLPLLVQICRVSGPKGGLSMLP